MQPTKWYEESPGMMSSKRIWGAGVLALGVAMKLVIFIKALFGPLGDAQTDLSISDGMVYAGASLLGLTALDAFKRQ